MEAPVQAVDRAAGPPNQQARSAMHRSPARAIMLHRFAIRCYAASKSSVLADKHVKYVRVSVGMIWPASVAHQEWALLPRKHHTLSCLSCDCAASTWPTLGLGSLHHTCTHYDAGHAANCAVESSALQWLTCIQVCFVQQVESEIPVAKFKLLLCDNSIHVGVRWESAMFLHSRFTSDQKEGLTGASGVTITTYTMIAFSGKRSEESAKVMDQIRSREWGLLLMDEVHVVPAQMFRKVCY